MGIRLETIYGPSFEKLRDFTFSTKSSIPIAEMLVFKVRGLRKTAADAYREGPTATADTFPFTTLAEDGDGFCLVRLERMSCFEPYQPSEQIWVFKGKGRIIGGEGAAYADWLSEEFGHLRQHQQRYCLDFEWNDYSTKTRKGLLWEITKG